jgi:hypothetical protein
MYEDAIYRMDVIDAQDCSLPWSTRPFIFRLSHPDSQQNIGISLIGCSNGRVLVDLMNFRKCALQIMFGAFILLFVVMRERIGEPKIVEKFTICLRIQISDEQMIILTLPTPPHPASFVFKSAREREREKQVWGKYHEEANGNATLKPYIKKRQSFQHSFFG